MGVDHELSPEDLRRTFDLQLAGIETTELVSPVEGIIGQERALSALRTGLGIQDPGFNIYVSGPPGIGKMTAVLSFLEDLAQRQEPPKDWVYINNFEDPYQSKALSLPAGKGRQFQQDMKLLIENIHRSIERAYASEEYTKRHNEIVRDLSRRRETAMEGLMQRASEAGFIVRPTSFGMVIIPVREGRPIEDLDFAALPPLERQEIRSRREHLESELAAILEQLQEPQRSARDKLRELDRQVSMFIVGEQMDELRDKYRDLPEVGEYLTAVHKDILEDIESFNSPLLPSRGETESQPPWLQELPSRKYQVNLLVDSSGLTGAPVVSETNPSYNNLFGRVEKESHFGTLYTDFTMIRAGAIHRANGGYLVLSAEEVIQSPFCWDGLKRALKSQKIELEEPAERLGFMASKSLRPQPIPLDLKVILVGRPFIYYLLQAYDLDFPELCKVKADFDTSMEATDENIRDFLGLLASFCQQDKLKHLNRAAIAKMLEHSSRLAEDKEKLSTHFGALSDVLREAHFWAARENCEHIGAAQVQKALDEKVHRSNLIKQHIQELITRGSLLVDTTGEAVGQVNGISTMNLGDYIFGRPSRITATVGPGGQGIVDIEREVELGGAVHSKGVLIVGGYLAQKYARDMLLTLAGRLVFEQSYQGVEGDSASSAELFAVLSALSDLPIKQGIAVTGSVNQHGEVQPIGAVNQKIEGFFEVCRAQGITGGQGVIIPQRNVQNLMLSEEVVDAVRKQEFHIWAIDTVDQGMEILSGVPAGDRQPDSDFPSGTVNYLVQRRLRDFAEYLKGFPEGAGTPLRKASG